MQEDLTGASFLEADVLPEHQGTEMLVVVPTGRVIVLGQRRAPSTTAPEPHGDEVPLIRFAEALRADGWPGAAAEVYEANGALPSPAPARSWTQAVECWLDAHDTLRARQALATGLSRQAVADVEGTYWSGRIAEAELRRDEAVAAYRAVVGAADEMLDRSASRSQMFADARIRIDRLAQVERRFVHRLCFGSEVPSTLVLSRPFMALPDRQGRGLRLALHGQLPDDAVAFRVDMSRVRSTRVWARLVVHEEQYGGHLCLALSQPASPYALPLSAPQDSAWILLHRSDGYPRGIQIGCRIDGEMYSARDNRHGGRAWEWDRDLRLEILHSAKDGVIEFSVVDESNDRLLTHERFTPTAPLSDGVYQFGLWATHRINPWTSRVLLTVKELGCEIEPAEDGMTRLLLPPQPSGKTLLLRQAHQQWREDRDALRAAKMLVDGVEQDAELAELLEGPRPESFAELAGACLALRPGVGQELLDRGYDQELLSDLYLTGLLRPETQDQRATLHQALVDSGHLATAWKVNPAAPPAPPHRLLSPGERIRYAPFYFEDAEALRTFLRPLLDGSRPSGGRWQALRHLLLGALVREDGARALHYLRQLEAWPGEPPERLMDSPAIRRFAQRMGTR